MDRSRAGGQTSDLDVLWEEFRILHDPKAKPTTSVPCPEVTAKHAPAADRPLRGYDDLFQKIHGLGNGNCRTALCLSGGGIRSAAFNLGVLQGLARLRLLDQFSYLSTVSGGGYIGAWLWAWRRRTDLETLLAGLVWPDQLASSARPSELPAALANLRGKASYLAPRMGLLSSDTWTAIVLYLRNLVLNQIILLPLLIALVTVPKMLVIASYWGLAGGPAGHALHLAVLFLVFLAWILLAVERPAWRLQATPGMEDEAGNKAYKRAVVLSAYAGVILVTLAGCLASLAATPHATSATILSAIAPYLRDGGLAGGLALLFALFWQFVRPATVANTSGIPDSLRRRIGTEILLGGIAGGLAAWFAAASVGKQVPVLASGHVLAIGVLLGAMAGTAIAMMRDRADFEGKRGRELRENIRRGCPRIEQACLMACVSGLGGGALFWVGVHVAQTAELQIMLIFALAPLWLALCYVVADAIFLGFTARREPDKRPADPWGDQEREYLARSGGRMLFYAGGITIFCLATFFGPRLWTNGAHLFVALVSAVISFLGSVGISFSPLVGKKSGQESVASPWWFPADAIVTIATPIFIMIMISVVSFGIDYFYPAGQQGSALGLCWIFLGCLIVCGLAQWRISVNRFSLHDVYRLRLMREFLGASNENHDAAADGWTGFTATDDLKLHELWPQPKDPPQPRKHKPCLYPLINATLNLVETNRLAWQERKGEPFVFTPAHIGAVRLGYSDTKIAAGGFLLSSAMTLSGAAVSPNAGYTSKPALALLLTMFNLRLGAWVGDPRKSRHIGSRGPRYALLPLMAELFGWTTENGMAHHVFVSDGGHFDNLGIYEVLRRRCRYIVVSDAGRDPSYAFEDLGRVVRQAAIDLGTRITFVHLSMPPRPKPGEPSETSAVYAAFAKIEYPEIDKRTGQRRRGWLLYFKPGYQGLDEPADVRAYASRNPAFPHDSTLNQFFGESQFESYRQLGSYLMARFKEIAELEPGSDLSLVFDKVRKLHWPGSQEVKGRAPRLIRAA